jgi:hypothetical protein
MRWVSYTKYKLPLMLFDVMSKRTMTRAEMPVTAFTIITKSHLEKEVRRVSHMCKAYSRAVKATQARKPELPCLIHHLCVTAKATTIEGKIPLETALK